MLSALKAEIAKLTSLRSTWVYLILMTGSIFGPAVLLAVLNNDQNIVFEWGGGDTYSLWVYASTLPAYALMAAGIAALTRSKLIGSGLLITLCLVIEPLMDLGASKIGFVKTIFQLMPGSRMNDLTTWHTMESMGMNPAEQGNFASPAMSVIVIAAWVLALVAAAFVANKVRDTH